MSQKRRRPPPREANEEEKSIIIAVRHCARELDDILQGARRKAQGDSKLFADKTASSLFRGTNTYQKMYSKLNVKSRQALSRLFHRSHDLEDMVDARDCIEETEDCWRQFLSNLDSDVRRCSSSHKSHDSVLKTGDFIDLSRPKLVDCKNFSETTLEPVLSKNASSLLIFQPSYLPDTAARCRHSEISKVIADFYQLNAGFVIITWGPESVVKPWATRLLKHVKWPVLWDRDFFFPKFLSFKRGCAHLWAPEMLDFCAYQNFAHKRTIEPPPLEIDWSEWNYVGGEVVIASPAVTRMFYHRDMETRLQAIAKAAVKTEKKGHEKEENDLDEDESDLPPLPPRPDTNSARICYIHRADNIADMAVPSNIYQSALNCFAVLHKKTENEVVEAIRTNRRLSTPPENGRLQYEAATGLYYDPETQLHYDSRSGYFYDAVRKTYYYWSADEHRYIPANELVKAQQEKAHQATIAAAQEAARKAVREQAAARAAAARVSAQLAALRGDKDEYASYALSTCLVDEEDIASIHASYSTNIQESLQQLGGSSTSYPYSHSSSSSKISRENDLYPPGCPPPPGT